jgi:uncharacterized protein YqgC (DUF456 family)
MDIAINLIGFAMIIGGLAGTVLPLLPSTPLMFAGMLLLAWHDQFIRVGWFPLTLLLVLTIISSLLEYLAGAMGAKRVGASQAAIWGALIGSVVGILGGIPGMILGPFIGAAAGEMYARQDLMRAGQVGIASGVGILLGAIAKVGLAIAMLGVFLFAWFI